MDRTRPDQGWRATAFAVALFAITLNFLQPLAHAALLRDGAPRVLWTAFCNSMAADPAANTSADKNSRPATVDAHECCLGLAHAVAFTAPASIFITLAPLAVTLLSLPIVDRPTPAGIRDGPTQPRGPPSLA